MPSESPSIQLQLAQAILVTSLGQNIEHELKANIALSLGRLQLTQLFEPTMLLLHGFIDHAVNAMHYTVFKEIIYDEFCLNATDSYSEFDVLYKYELAEHGDRNITKFCEEYGFNIALTFPDEEGVVAAISYPVICEQAICLNSKLVNALGYQSYKKNVVTNSKEHVVLLIKQNTTHSKQNVPHSYINLPTLLTPQAEMCSLQAIFSQLDYGIVRFAGTGSILTTSPSILTRLGLDATVPSIQVLAKSIPAHFYNDVIWGFALEEQSGVFENYRIRLKPIKDSDWSMLFNISGYRDQDAIIHTLWQAVSLDKEENNNLSEGSILIEARVHNITRNYVPQIVEEKARETVRLGGTKLINEECFIAVLFCDIVGFTAYVENNENEESVIHTLNTILRKISKSVKLHGGLIDKFMGDCVMALFRNPHDAVVAALEMQNHSIDINNMRIRAGQEALQLRIGVHWGKVVIGNIGTPERLDWTTIGDVVNTASRIETHCQPGAVLISKTIQDAITTENHTDIKYGEIFYLQVKGKQKKVAVCYSYPILS